MTNSKNTKKALLMSAISLVLCFSMLIGTTFAWFTDEVNSGLNQIVAGNLDVEVYTQSGTSITNEKVLFDEIKLWEPGVVAYENITVVNEGTLALKYQLSVNFDNAIKTPAGKTLADALQVAVVPGYITETDRDKLVAGISSWQKLSEWVENGDLLKGESDQYGIVIWWEPTDSDNDFNMNNDNQDIDLSIDLGIKLTATQLMAEDDSFGDDYDEDAVYGTFIELNEGDNLLAALASAEAGKPVTIKLLGNVEWPTEGHHGENDITPASEIVINGNGYTITATGSGVTPLGDTEAPMTLKNVKIIDKSASYNEGAWELSYLEVGGSVLNCVNVEFADPIMVESDNATFTGCSFLGYEDTTNSINMNGVWMYNGNATFTNCKFEGARGIKICDMYSGGEVGTVIIDNCRFIGLTQKPGVAIDDCDTQEMQITIKNSTFIQCQPGDQGLYVYETDNTVPTVENNTVDNNTALAGNVNALTDAINDAQAGDTIIVTDDINVGSSQFAVNKDVTIDLNSKELTTANNWGGMTLAEGASIKNGTINHTGNTAAIKVSGSAGSIENVTINMTPTAGKTKTGIQVYNGKYVEKISNVTITGATQGIEVAKGSRVNLIENVTVKAVDDGDKKGVALLVNAAFVGKAVNCTFEGSYGVYMMLNGEFTVALELDNCTVTGSTAALIAHDEAGISNTNNCSLTLTYDAKTVFNGAFVWEFEEECQGVVTLNKP